MTAERVLNERYEVLELIGRGGMADVHLGRDLKLGRKVAIKLLRQDLARDPLFQSRFRREAQAVAGLNDPTIVGVYDTGDEEVPDKPQHEVRIPFIVMEYVAGRTLRDYVKAGELTPERSVTYLAGVLGALDYSHRAGIVHRDIKPANVMITPEGAVKVMDFGIARALADSQATMTQTHAVLGTAQYLSPEQARGETVDARSDLYSAGCLLFELLTGRPPFIGDSPVSVAYQHVREDPLSASSIAPSVTPALDSVLARALEKDREHRFQDAASFRTALLEAARGIVLADGTGAPTESMTVPAGVAGVPPTMEAAHTTAIDRVDEEDAGWDGDGQGTENDTGFLDHGHDADDDRERRRRSSRAAWITVFFTAVLIVLGAGFFAVSNLGYDPTAGPTTEAVADVVVPDLVGMEAEEASDAVMDEGLRVSSDQEYHDSVGAGLVISSDPSSGASVPPDSQVTMVVSLGPANITVPESILEMTEASARDALDQAGLRGGSITEENSATVPEGRVLRTSPQVGESAPAGSVVDLVLSTGRVTVPLLTDLTLDQAESELSAPSVRLPFTVTQVENSVVAPGIVTGQSSPARSEVDQGTVIELEVAVAPPEAPAPAPPAPETSGPEPDPEESEVPGEPVTPAPSDPPDDASEGRPTLGPEEADDDDANGSEAENASEGRPTTGPDEAGDDGPGSDPADE